jgi:hypothetical protein
MSGDYIRGFAFFIQNLMLNSNLKSDIQKFKKKKKKREKNKNGWSKFDRVPTLLKTCVRKCQNLPIHFTLTWKTFLILFKFRPFIETSESLMF